MEVRIGESDLTVEAVSLVAEGEAEVVLTEGARESIIRGRKLLEKALDEDRTIYGLNTGVGDFQGVVIPHEKILQLQKNLVRSTAAGVGDPLSEEMVRAMMLLRVNALTLGYSGVRLNLVSLLVDMLNRRVHPVIPSKGSVGSSGDMVPLAHMALVVMGEGKAVVREKTIPGKRSAAGGGPVSTRVEGQGRSGPHQRYSVHGGVRCTGDPQDRWSA